MCLWRLSHELRQTRCNALPRPRLRAFCPQMKVSLKTRNVVDSSRREAHRIKMEIERELVRLNELPGVAKHAKILQRAIRPLDDFIAGQR